jgi:transcriptional regulator with XRE-family HTH domain
MFGKRIVELRKKKGLTQSALSEILGISRSALSLYEIEKREPDINTLNNLASIFNVPVGYILGDNSDISDYFLYDQDTINAVENKNFHNFFNNEDITRGAFLLRLKKAISECNMSEESFLANAPMGATRAKLILNGKTDPSANDLVDLSHYLKTSTDYLLGQTPVLTFDEKKLVNTYIQLDEDNRDILMGHAKELLKKQKYAEAIAADETPQKMAK